MQDFVDRHGLEGMTQVVDDDLSIWSRFGVRVQPAWAFVDQDGEVDPVFGGLFDDALAARVREAFGDTR